MKDVSKLSQLKNRAKAFVDKNLRSDELDMYKSNKMDYKVKDSTFSDIYERGNEDESDSRVFVYLMPWLVVLLWQIILLVFIPVLLMAVNQQAHGHYFKVLLALYLMPIGGLLRGLLAIGVSAGLYFGIKVFAERYWESQNVSTSRELLNQYKYDSRLQQPEELIENFDMFPDGGAHSHFTDVTAILGHIMLNNDGLNDVKMPLRADGKTDRDDDGVLLGKNVLFYDENDETIETTKSLIDEAFGEQLWDSAGIPRPMGKNAGYIKRVLRRRYSPDKLLYNPMKKFGKPDIKTVAERINQDWYMPNYEVQRPAGAYVVDTEPNNTMV